MTGAPLTGAAFGSTRCPGCEKRYALTPTTPVVDVVGEEWFTRRGSVSGGEHRTVTRRWHESCLREFEAHADESRRAAAEQHESVVRELCAASGVDYDAMVARTTKP